MRGVVISPHSLAAVVLVAISASAMILSRACFGFQFPVPWPDETGFVSPAYNLAFTGSLFDAGMNPDRLVMWMPPGYMVVLAGAFRLFGYSYAFVRWMSAAFVLASLGVTARTAWRATCGWRRPPAIAAVALAFVSPAMLLSGNNGRMESLFCCLVLLALAAGVEGRLYVMTALLGFSALVHPNAMYFLPVLPVAFGARAWSGTLGLPGRVGWLALALCAVAGGGYVALIATHWEGFLTDMQVQIAVRRWNMANPDYPKGIMYVADVILLWRAVTVRRFDSALLIACFGASFVTMVSLGRELWYDYGQPLGFALLAVACLSDKQTTTTRRQLAQAFLPAAVSGAMILILCVRTTPIMRAFLPTTAMLTRNVVPSSDIKKIRRFIASLKPGTTVDFGWTGMECFFLDDLHRVGARWTIIRHSVTQVFPLRGSDWRVACDSNEIPKPAFNYDVSFKRSGLTSGCEILPGLVVQKAETNVAPNL